MEKLIRDVRYGLRMLAKAPAFTALAIVTLALGIGANTAIFSVANFVLLRPLPFQNSSQLVLVSTQRDDTCCVSLPYFMLLQETNRSFSSVAAYQFDTVNLSRRDGAEYVDAERVTWNFFDVLGVKPLAGRAFTAAEDQPGSDKSVMIAYELAARLFGGAGDAIGQHLALNSRDYTIAGVLPPNFGGQLLGRKPQIWMTRLIDLSMTTAARVNIGGSYYFAFGRLRPGVTAAQARAEADVIFQQYKHDSPANFDATSDVAITVGDLRADLDPNVRPTLLILSAAVGCVLLIACANVASLLLSRGLGRQKEFAVRSALGATRSTVIRQVLTESLMMAAASGLLGIAIGWGATRFLAASMQANLPQIVDVPMDLRVLAFALAISLLSGILFGLAPALQLARPDLGRMLAEEGRSTTGSRQGNRMRSFIVTGQVAISMVLLIGSGLLIRSFVRLRTVNPGFDAANVLTARMFLPVTTYPQAAQRILFYRSAIQRLQSTPGVESAALSTALPVLANHATPARFEGQPDVELGQRPVVLIESVSPDYAKTLRVPLLEGRPFSDSDDAKAAPVVMVNQAVVRKFWPNENPIGKLVWVGNLPPATVVGVLGDVKNQSLSEPSQPEVFLPYPQLASATLYVSVRARADARSMAAAVREQIAAVNSGQPISDVRTMEERLNGSSAQTGTLAMLIGVFSAAALILAVVGIYGVIAYSVAQRTQELGVRLALGASNADILRLVIGGGLRLALAGIVIGVAASFALTRLMASQLYATSAVDPVTFAGSAALFTAVAAIASYLPARRAMHINPADALRSS